MPAPMNARCREYVKSSLSLSNKLGFFMARGDRLSMNLCRSKKACANAVVFPFLPTKEIIKVLMFTQKKENYVHYCGTRCQSCGYFCQLPIDHSGLHDTVHDNMKNVRFISEGEDIDIQDHKYKWGETGEAEMCNMYCKKQGRGHIHLVTCPGSGRCTGNLYDGSRHETVKYGPDVDVPKDEMTHGTYWQYVRFVDRCTEEEREEFDRCNHYCKSEGH
ncbi:hypothetical protein SUGI_0602770 [Cryptomeria japonica]|nr:hypothetical protein SUGI_0602770 [Cryptomeria japonica]